MSVIFTNQAPALWFESSATTMSNRAGGLYGGIQFSGSTAPTITRHIPTETKQEPEPAPQPPTAEQVPNVTTHTSTEVPSVPAGGKATAGIRCC